jgi:hypothetical protein
MSKQKYIRIIVQQKCKICSNSFDQEIIDSNFGRSTLKKCCSLSCSGKCSDKHKIERILISTKCKKCKCLFEQKILNSIWGKTQIKHFCSRSCASSSHIRTKESKEKTRLSLLGHFHNNITKCKMRKSAIKRVENMIGQISPNYNLKSIILIEQKAQTLGITDLQHAENGGEFYIKELGYWVDGYSLEKNIVIEVDEKYHQSKRQQNKDKLRQKEIIEFLRCKFIRLKI